MLLLMIKSEAMVNQFDRFINENHNSTAPHDQHVLAHWREFRNILQKSPNEAQSYISKMREEAPLPRSASNSPMKEVRPIPNRKSGFEINMGKLKSAGLNLVQLVNRFNKELEKTLG